MEKCRCEAILLGSMDYREADRIVTLFTLEQGKLKGIARGAKRSSRRFGCALEPFTRISVQLGLATGLVRLEEADIITSHPRILDDLVKIAHAGYACESVDLLMPEGLPNPRLYRLLSAYLEHLDTVSADSSDRRFFQVNLLNILGYRPPLENCATCGDDLMKTTTGLHAGPTGRLFCGSCGRGYPAISKGTIINLEKSLHTGRFGRVAFSSIQLDEAGIILDQSIALHLSRPFKSLEFLREVECGVACEVS